MAFLNRVGNALKQTVSKHVVSQLPTSNASLFQAMRCMSTSSKLFVGGLSYSTDEMSLREAFAQYGEVVEARIITDRETGRSRGFGFVTFTSSEEASSAIQAFDGQDLHGRRIRVNHATEKPRGGFGGVFGGGGYGGQGNYGGGGYQGGNYQGGGGGYSSGNQYPSRGGGYGSPPSGGAGGYGGGDSLPADGNYSGGASNYSGAQASFSSILNDVTTGPREPLGDLQDSIDDGKEDFEDTLDENTRDDNEEPNDYANTRS